MRHGRLVALVIGGVLVSAAASGAAEARPAPGGPWTVTDLGAQGAVVAGYRTRALPQPTMRSLIRSWGPPDRLATPGASGGRSCLGIWSVPRARVLFANLGSLPPGTTVCRSRIGFVQIMATVGPRWRTDRGLAVGARADRVTFFYPGAVEDTGSGLARSVWLLRPRRVVCLGDCGGGATTLTSSVIAVTPAGRIARFHIGVGGAGE